MQVTEHVFVAHIDDKAAAHPGGSNIYFVGDPKDHMVIIDSGDQAMEWRNGILQLYEKLGRPNISSILITHGHADHIGGLDRLFEVVQAPVRCHPKLVEKHGEIVGEDNVLKINAQERISAGPGLSLLAINTPGHEVDHVCYYMRKEKVLFTGDTILGSSSSTVRDLSDYMKSLHKLSRYSLDVICPAHGALVENPRASRLIPWYIKHREEREKQVLLAVSNGVSDVDQMVKQIYPRNLKKALRRAAAGNVRTHLDKLVKDGTVEEKPVSYTLKG